jgi:micrococcal nuclease
MQISLATGRRDDVPVRLVAALIIVTLLLPISVRSGLAQDRNNRGENRDSTEWEIPEDAEPALFLKVVDGDTIIVELMDEDGHAYERTVRMIGIDTPETNYSYGNRPECFGKQATNKTDSLLVAADGEIWLEKDVSDEDRNGRLLRYVWYESEIDGKVRMLNEQLVREGYALAKTYRPDTKWQDELDEAERVAIENAAGMWLACDASVSMEADEEQDGEPDSAPIDRTKVPANVEEDAACSLFDTFDQAQDFLDEFPELADMIDPDFDGVACEDYFEVNE